MSGPGVNGRPRGKAALLTDAEAAAVVNRCAAAKTAPKKDVRNRLGPFWQEIAALAAESGQDGVAEALAWLATRDAVRHSAIVAALRGETAPETETAQTTARPAPKPFVLPVIESAEFFRTTYSLEWHIKRVLVAGQPCVIGGPKKALKTSVIVDAAISMGMGLPFLGKFDVPQPIRVGLFSGESGTFTIQDTARRVCREKNLEPSEIQNVFWGFALPQLSNDEHLGELTKVITERRLEVVIIDPLYLCLLSGSAGRRFDASNMFDMGPLLLSITAVCLEAGATPVLVHHFKKGREPYEMPELEDLAFAGIQEFARQWILFGRRKKYDPGSGVHRLWLVVGGSAGHSGEWALDIAEGVMDDNFQGREWRLAIQPASEVHLAKKKAEKEAKVQKQLETCHAKDEAKAKKREEDCTEALVLLAKIGASTEKTWRTALNWNPDRLAAVIAQLSDAGRILPTKVPVLCGNGSRQVDGWRVNPGDTGTPEHTGTKSESSGVGHTVTDTGTEGALPLKGEPLEVPVSEPDKKATTPEHTGTKSESSGAAGAREPSPEEPY